MAVRRKKYKKEDHIFGLDREADIKSMLVRKGIKHVWHNEHGESFKDIDFDIWMNEKFIQICSEAISASRADEIYTKSRIRWRTSAIREQAIKPHSVLYIQPWYDGSFAYWLSIKTLYKYLEMPKRDREELGIHVYDLPINGEDEEFMDTPLRYVKEMR